MRELTEKQNKLQKELTAFYQNDTNDLYELQKFYESLQRKYESHYSTNNWLHFQLMHLNKPAHNRHDAYFLQNFNVATLHNEECMAEIMEWLKN